MYMGATHKKRKDIVVPAEGGAPKNTITKRY